MNRIFLSALFLGLLAAGCEKTPQGGDQQPLEPEQPKGPVLNIENELVSLEREVGKFTLDFTSTDPWKASCDASWVSLVGAEGQGSEDKSSLTVFYNANCARKEREASLVVKSGELADTLKIVQAAPHDATISDFFKRVSEEGYIYQYICAHRANTYDGIFKTMNCPENSVPAVERCIQQGLDMVEIDVRMTKDGYLVCCHDEGISNVTNGKGNVADLTFDEIRSFDAKVRAKGLVVKGVKMATLGEILDACKDRIWVNLDLSKVSGTDFFTKVVDDVVQHGMEHQVTFYIGSSADKANTCYNLCNALSIHLYIGDVSAVQSKIPNVKTVPVLQIGAGTWNGVTPTLPNQIRDAGYCAFSNMLDYDSKITGGNTSYLEYFTAARIDFMQTDYGDNIKFQNFLKSKNLR